MPAALFAAAAALIVAPVPKAADFDDWTAACDNARHCEAIALPSEAGGQGGWTLHLSRGAQAMARPSVEAAPAYQEREYGAVRLKIDDRASAFRFDRNGRLVGDLAAFLAAIAAAGQAEVVDAAGKSVGTIPLKGASAALRWIDDRQMRVGTVTALVARGARPASDVPPPPILRRIEQPPFAKAPPRKLRSDDANAIQLLAGDLCDPDQAAPATYRLDARHTLGIVGCLMGAYQGASLVVVIDQAGKWSPAPIEQPGPLAQEAAPFDAYLLTEADYAPKERLLSMHAKGRGLADCGEAASWAWDGTLFRLASYSALAPCLGAPPGTWLSRWQTANDPLTEQ